MKSILTALVLVLSLTGCGATLQPSERIVYKVIRVPVELTEKVTISKPPEPVSYSALDWNQQEGLLMDLIQEHTKTIGVCNARISGIGAWSVKQAAIYETEQ